MPATKLGDILLTKKLGTKLTLSTNGKYIDNDVAFDIAVQQGVGSVTVASTDAAIQSDSTGRNISAVIGQKATTTPGTGYYIKIDASGTGTCTITTAGWVDVGTLGTANATGSFYFPIQQGTVSVSGTNTVTPSASIAGNNVTLSNTNNGIQVTATGGGTASASAVATGNVAGFIPINEEAGTGTIAGTQQTTTASTYLSGVTLPVPTSGTNSFSITLPNGSNDTITFVFQVNTNGNTEVIES